MGDAAAPRERCQTRGWVHGAGSQTGLGKLIDQSGRFGEGGNAQLSFERASRRLVAE